MKSALIFPVVSIVLLPLAMAVAGSAEPAAGGPAAAIMAEVANTETGGDTVTWVVSPGMRNEVTIKTADGFRTVTSNGWPDHEPGQFPRRGNPNTPTGQQYKFRMPLAPKASEQPVFRGGWWWGVALNGVPFEPGTGETWNNDPRSGWRYEAATGFLNLGLDEHNAHVQPNGSYHYHALPKGMVEKLGGDEKKMLLVGWAADGFPLYTSRAYSEPKNAGSTLRAMKSSYRLRDGRRPEEPEGPGGAFDGRFSQDFEFVKDSGDLDECNGRTGVTPEFPEGTYYYCITAEFPFVPRKWRGEPDASFGKGGPPPGGGGRGGMRPGGQPRGILEEPGGPPQGGQGGPGGRAQGVPPVMEALDLNKDGRLDRDELGKAAESLKKLDANGDGTIGPEEYRPAGGPGGRP
jgi:hypothetical protein